MKKVQRQERVVEEVKMVMKPAYNHKKINKDQYKEILRKAVPKVTIFLPPRILPLKAAIESLH